MKILNKLTIQDLKLNKKRTIVTILGIMLSTALIVAVAGMITSLQATLVEGIKKNEGNFHTIIKNVSLDDQKYILQNRDVKESFKMQKLGYANLEKSDNQYKPYLYVMGFDDKAISNFNITLVDGRMPNNDNEIIISDRVLKDALVSYKVGDNISLDLSKRYFKDDLNNELDQLVPYGGDYKENKEEVLIKESTKKYKVVGIFERPSDFIENYDAPGYTVITKYKENSSNIDIGVIYNNIKDTNDNTKKIVKYLEVTSPKITSTTNNDLLNYSLVGLSNETMNVFYTLGGIVILIIIVSSIFVIRNSFSISITEKLKSYGMLASIGATKKQIKKNVLYEGFVLGVIAIPLGIIVGIIAVIILINIVNILIGNLLNGFDFVYSVPLIPIILAIILSSLTIYFSTIFTAIKASHIPPITAIRSNQDIKIKSKKLRTPKIIKIVFKIGGVISYKNLKRSKRKYRTTVISLVVSIVIFIALSAFITYGFKMSNVYYKELNYNYYVYNSADVDHAKEKEMTKKLLSLDGIEKYSYGLESNISGDFKKYFTEYGKKQNTDNPEAGKAIDVIALKGEEYNRYVKKIGGDVNKYKGKAILVDDYLEYGETKKYQYRIYNLKAKDKISGLMGDKKVEIEIAKVTDVRPMGYEGVYSNTGFLFVNEEYASNFDSYTMSSIFLKVTDGTKYTKSLEELKKNNSDYYNIEYIDMEEEAKAMNAIVLVISIFLYGFITVITLIGVTNIFNTITTNMNLRSKEFMMLKSIGMTTKEFNHMIRLESLLYGLKSLIIGIPLGTILSYLIYKAVINSLEMAYVLPIKPIIISIIFVFIIVGLTMKYSLNKINKQNIIETLRNDNI